MERRTRPSFAPLVESIAAIDRRRGTSEAESELRSQLANIFHFFDANPLKRMTDTGIARAFGFLELARLKLARGEAEEAWKWYEAGREAVLDCYKTELRALRKPAWQFWK